MKRTSICNNYFVSFYKRMMKRKQVGKKRIISDRYKVKKLQNIIWETVLEHYIQNEGGVYIDNFGYLCHIINPKRNFGINHLIGEVMNIHTNGHRYRHVVLDFSPKSQYYHIDLSTLTKRKSRNKKYKFLYREVCAKRHLGKVPRIPKVFKEEELKCR